MRVSWLVVLSTLLVLPGQASSLDYLSPDELIAQADFIVRARVFGQQAIERGPAIYTRYTVRVTEVLKGTPAEVLELVMPGGASGGLRHVVPGTPRLAVGAEYLLFLREKSSDRIEVLGLAQGVFQIQTDSRGEPVASQAGTPGLIREVTSGQFRVYEPLRLGLGDLRQMIRSARDPRVRGARQ